MLAAEQRHAVIRLHTRGLAHQKGPCNARGAAVGAFVKLWFTNYIRRTDTGRAQRPSRQRMKFSKLITDYRKANGLTQRDLAARLDVSVVAVSNWEQGSKKPTIASRMALADVLNIPQALILPEIAQATSKLLTVNEPDLIKLVRACRRIPPARRPELLKAMLIVASQAAAPVPVEELPASTQAPKAELQPT